jgi:hypothetical protein
MTTAKEVMISGDGGTTYNILPVVPVSGTMRRTRSQIRSSVRHSLPRSRVLSRGRQMRTLSTRVSPVT